MNQVIAGIDLDLMQSGEDFSLDIRIDKGFRNLKMFSKDIQFSVIADETDKGNSPFRNVIELGQGELSGKQEGFEIFFLAEL